MQGMTIQATNWLLVHQGLREVAELALLALSTKPGGFLSPSYQ